MSIKQSNEITVKIKCEIEEIYKILEEKGFKVTDRFSMDDTYFIPKTLQLEKMTTREILQKAVLVREITGKISGNITRRIIFKIKDIDEDGNILRQEAINCDIVKIEEANKLLEAIGYQEIMNIKENDVVYGKEGFELAIKDIKNGDKLIEIETDKQLDTVEKLIEKVKQIEIPIYTDNYFVKKAEIELEKILNKK